MSFDETLSAVRDCLASEGRVAYRTLKRRFDLDDEDLEDIRAELVDAKRLARDEDGRVLVWCGDDADACGPAATADTPVPPEAADRRLITVMFCDIVGSTELAARFDAEELRELIGQYQSVCAAVIAENEGHIAQYLGDGLLIYFGYPLALEDEASAAVRTGLGILAALHGEDALTAAIGEPLQVRIGVHTGPVVVGEVGDAARAERLALGETPNIAARVQSAARPGEMLITADTHRLVEGLFDCERHGPHELKGVGRPIELFTVRGEGAALNRFEVALSTGALTRYIGREQELGLLRGLWEQACNGQGQVVLLDGEPGIGKSRLAQEFRNETGEDVRHITLRCSPNHQKSAYYPVAQVLQRLFGFEREEDDEACLRKVERGLEGYAFTRPDTPLLLADVLALEHPDGARLDRFPPAQRKRMTFETLTAWMLEEASRAPVFMIWDDVHWLDPLTHELLAHYMDHIPASRTMAVLAFRSDYAPSWEHRAYLNRLTLPRLPERDVETIVRDVTGRADLPPTLLQAIVAKTDGVPLYVEELSKAVIESGVLDTPGEDAGTYAPAIPATLQDSLEARIDHCRLGKDIAQWGAVVGREFPLALLEHLVPDRQRLRRGLDELLAAELVYRSGTADDRTYIFKHALVRDTAYDSLLNRERRARHGEIAEVIETHFEELAEREPELLAYHYVEAGAARRAVDKLHEAAESAVERAADAPALAFLHQALALLPQLPDDRDRARLELRINLLLGPLTIAAHGAAAPEVKSVYERALALCDRVSDEASRLPAYFGLRQHHLATLDLDAAHEIGEAMHRTAAARGSVGELLEANIALTASHYHRGDFDAVERITGEALDLYERGPHERHAYMYGVEPGAACLIRAANVAWIRGTAQDASERLRQALDHTEALAHSASRAFVLSEACDHGLWLQDYAEVTRLGTAALDIADEHGLAFYRGTCHCLLGYAAACSGEPEAGLEQIAAGIELLDGNDATGRLRTQTIFPYLATLWADAHGHAGNPESGLALLPEAIALMEKSGAHGVEATMFRVRGDLLLRMQLLSEAEKSLQRAIAVAERQGAHGFALRAALSLATVWLEQGRGDEARREVRTRLDRLAQPAPYRDVVAARRLVGDAS